ncbi:MAG: hypothetical protein EOM54_10045 [Clostridia bacterium]|nr:hypothetical protein [Clostridia bacterium]
MELRRYPRRRSDVITLSKKELEETIVAAYDRIEDKREKKRIEALATDKLAKSSITLIQSTFIVIALSLFCLFIVFVLSFFPSLNLAIISTFYDRPIGYKIIWGIVSIFYSISSASLAKAVGKETDRNYLVSYFSAITAITALIVAAAKY